MLEQEAEERKAELRKEAATRADAFHAGEWLPGWLVAARKAPFHHNYGESESYYIKLKTAYGVQQIWGTDLERAVKDSKSRVKVGDAIAVRITRKEPFVITLDTGKQETRSLNHYEVERATYVVRRQQVARKILEDPISPRRAAKDGKMLTGSRLINDGADILADAYRLAPEQRTAFLDRVKLAAGIIPSAAPSEAVPVTMQSGDRQRDVGRRRVADFRNGAWLGGRLLEARRAPYHDDPNNSDSFVIKLETSYGVQNIWGVDLRRAIEKSRSHVKVGDVVSIRITQPEKIATVGRADFRTLNHYEIERTELVSRRERAVRKILDDPVTARREGKGGKVVRAGYLLVKGSELLADALMLDPTEREVLWRNVKTAAAFPTIARDSLAQYPIVRDTTSISREQDSRLQQGFARD